MKRAFDCIAALAGLTILAIPMALIALAVWLEDRRSPFYLGIRVGRGARKFRMVKFRTMRPDAWRSGVNSTAAGDPRVTRAGGLLRAAKLDELPQLINVLLGQMSLVGPRPQVPADANMYTVEECRMLDVRPGITDLASLVFADEAEILSGSAHPDLLYNQIVRPWKSRLALAWIDHSSLLWDLDILSLTFLAAFSRGRALRGVARILEAWNADPQLRSIASRKTAPIPWPPPGASEIVSSYPQAAHA